MNHFKNFTELLSKVQKLESDLNFLQIYKTNRDGDETKVYLVETVSFSCDMFIQVTVRVTLDRSEYGDATSQGL